MDAGSAYSLRRGGVMGKLSLKTKMALTVSILFATFVSLLAYVTLSYLQREYRSALSRQQQTLVSLMREIVDDGLRVRMQALEAGMKQLAPAAALDPARGRRYLEDRPTLRRMFDGGLFIFTPDGKAVSRVQERGEPLPADPSLKPFLRAVAGGTARLSPPFPEGAEGFPAILLTVPIRNGRGKTVAIACGRISLSPRAFLSDFIDVKVGGNGYFFLTTADRIVLYHPDRTRMMRLAAPAGSNRLYDLALSCFTGSGETITSKGVPVLSTFDRLRTTGWIIGASLPLREAYAPFRTAKGNFILATLAGTAAFLGCAWLMMRHLTAPLAAITMHVARVGQEGSLPAPIDIRRDDEIGTLAGAFNAMVAELVRQQEILRDSEIKFRTIADFTADWEYWLGPDRRLVYCSPSCSAITGYDQHEFLDNPALIDEIIHPEDRPCVASHHRANHGENELTLDFRIVRKEGDVRWFSHSCRLVRDAAGEPLGRRVSNRDITERKRAEQLVRQLNAELEERVRERTAELEASTRELEAFCYSVSHDLRTPLRGIDGFSRILLEESGDRLTPGDRQYLERIGAAAVRMGKLIDALLDISRVTRTEVHPEPVDLSTMVGEAAEELRSADPGRDVEFVIAPDVTASADPRLLRLAIENLLGNAWKFTSHKPQGRIEFGCRESGEQPVFFVRDNGAGFDMRYAHKLFTPFQRLHAMAEYPGTGVGLVTVHRIITKHGGTIWAEAETEQGATFCFTLGRNGSTVHGRATEETHDRQDHSAGGRQS